MTKEETAKQIGRIIAKAWADEAFKQSLLADATSVLKQEGLDVPQGVTIKAIENTDQLTHIVLPLKPGIQPLSEELLDSVAGGQSKVNIPPITPCSNDTYNPGSETVFM